MVLWVHHPIAHQTWCELKGDPSVFTANGKHAFSNYLPPMQHTRPLVTMASFFIELYGCPDLRNFHDDGALETYQDNRRRPIHLSQ